MGFIIIFFAINNFFKDINGWIIEIEEKKLLI